MFIQYLARAKGSAGEFRAQLYVALEQEYLTKDEFQSALSLAETCSRQLYKIFRIPA
jgi:four helix bundle protein